MNRSLLPVVLTITLILPLAAIAESAARVELDAAQEVGSLPYLFRSGMFAWGAENVYPQYLQEKFFGEHRPGAIEVGTTHILYHSQSFDDVVARLRGQPGVDAFLKRTQDHGGKVVIALFGMPRWLSSNPDATSPIEAGEWMSVWGASPPKDYGQWTQLVETIVDYYSNQLGLDAWYKVWWEPDGVRWQGTEEELFKLYRATVVGARRAHKSAPVGGPSPSGWSSIFWRNSDAPNATPMLHNFIRYCATSPVPELSLDRVPIDFLVWHQFHNDPSRGFRRATSEIKTWLKTFGYPETTPTLIGEWSTWKDPGPLSPERDTEYTASYAIAAIIAMSQAGITHHSFTSMVEQQPQKFSGEFGGDFGIFTKSLIIKPVYNAFRTLSYLGEKRLKVEVADPFLAAVGTRDTASVALLIANFIPDGVMLRQAVGFLLEERGYTRKDLAAYGLSREKLEPLVKEFKQRGKVDAQAHGLPQRVQPDLNDVAALAQQIFTRNKEAVAVDVHLQHLPADFVRYERYLIDAAHSNSYAVRDRIGASVQRAKRDARGQAEQLLLQRGRSRQEIERLKALLARGEIQRIRERADPDAQAAYARYMQSNTAAVGEINEWPEVQLQKVEEKTIGSTGEYRETLSLPAYSVTLIRLSR